MSYVCTCIKEKAVRPKAAPSDQWWDCLPGATLGHRPGSCRNTSKRGCSLLPENLFLDAGGSRLDHRRAGCRHAPAPVCTCSIPHGKPASPHGTAPVPPPGFARGDPTGQGGGCERQLSHAVSLPDRGDQHLLQVLPQQDHHKPETTPDICPRDVAPAQKPSWRLALPSAGERGDRGMLVGYRRMLVGYRGVLARESKQHPAQCSEAKREAQGRRPEGEGASRSAALPRPPCHKERCCSDPTRCNCLRGQRWLGRNHKSARNRTNSNKIIEPEEALKRTGKLLSPHFLNSDNSSEPAETPDTQQRLWAEQRLSRASCREARGKPPRSSPFPGSHSQQLSQ